jgi:hypothetical protein
LRDQWKEVKYLIVDEISMISTRMLNEINLNLQLAKDSSELFGGLTVLFAGDFYQLTPFKGNALFYRDNIEKELFSENNTLINSQSINGRCLWLQITHAFKLDIQCRQTHDQVFSQILERLRNGTHTAETLTQDYDTLTRRILKSNLVDDPLWKDAKIIVSKNVIREEINKKKIKEHAANTNSNLFICKAKDSLVKHGINSLISIRTGEIVKTMLEADTGNLMTDLPLVYNAKYFITKNLAVKHGLVNGTEVLLKGFCTQEDKILVLDNTVDEIILKEMPKYLMVVPVIKNEHNPLKFPNLIENMIPIFAEDVYFYVKNNKPELSKTKSITVKRHQFPLTPAYAMTAYKAQGKTIEKVIIDLTRPRCRLDPAYVYVSLSRAKCLNDVIILMDFDINMLKTKNHPDLTEEMIRLKNLENKQRK